MSLDLLRSLDWSLLGGAVAVLGLTAALLMRDFRRGVLPRLGLALALGGMAFAFSSMPGVEDLLGRWRAPLRAIAAAQTVVLWLCARALFDDGFRLKPWHLGLWAGVALLYVVKGAAPVGSAPKAWVDIVLTVQAPVFALLAAAHILVTWRGDLVEARRRARAAVFGGIAGYSVLYAAVDLFAEHGDSSNGGGLGLSLAESAGLLAIALAAAWTLVARSDRRTAAIATSKDSAGQGASPLTASDRATLVQLETLMSAERLYRRENLSIGALAAQLGLPEYRLRRLINQGLGHRNFASFVNSYRLQDAKSGLADPHQAQAPILVIALDAGFGSLGPFNRAFKAQTGLTPTAFRAKALGAAAVSDATDISASRISNSA